MSRKYYRTSKNAEGCAFILFSLYMAIFGRRPTKKQVQALQTFLPTNAERPIELHPVDLERLALYVYQRLGYRKVKHTGVHSSTDGGVDVWMLRGDDVEIVQCKQQQTRVSKTQLIEFAKTMRQQHAEVGHYWAPGGFSQPALAYAEQNKIEIYADLEIRKLLEQVLEIEKYKTAEKNVALPAHTNIRRKRKSQTGIIAKSLILIGLFLIACVLVFYTLGAISIHL